MSDDSRSSFHSVRFVPATLPDSLKQSERTSNHKQVAIISNALVYLLGAIAYIELAALVYVLPTLGVPRPVMQLIAVGIGTLAVGVNYFLQRAILGDDDSISRTVVQTLVLDVNRTNRLK